MERTTKVQSPVALIGLSVVTLGVYTAFWYYRVNREMRDYGRARGDEDLAASKPVRSVLAWVPGGWIVVPLIVSFARATGRIVRCERLAGIDPADRRSIIALVVVAAAAGLGSSFVPATPAAMLLAIDVVCGLAAMAAVQRRLNAIWRRDAIAVPVTDERAAAAA